MLENHVGIAKNFDQDKKHCFLSKSGTLFIKLDHLKFIGRTKRGGRDKQFPLLELQRILTKIRNIAFSPNLELLSSNLII
jgi:hypothetical protein